VGIRPCGSFCFARVNTMALTEAEARAIAETEAQRPKQIQDAEGMTTGRSADDIIKLAEYARGSEVAAQNGKGLGFVRFKSPDALNRSSTSE